MTTEERKRLPINLNEPLQRVYLPDLLILLRMGRPLYYKRLKAGLLPQPDGRDNTRPYWLVRTIKPVLDGTAAGE